MKKIYFILLAFLFLTSLNNYSQTNRALNYSPGGYDSLLFDGADKNSVLHNSSCGCKIKILKQKGICYASDCEKKTDETCGLVDTFEVIKKGIIPSYVTEILDGDTIKTADFDGCELDLQLSDGKAIHHGPECKHVNR